MNIKSCLVLAFSLALFSCKDNGETKNEENTGSTTVTTPKVMVPRFHKDTAYAYVAAQVAMGPRTPGSAAQRKCADWIETRLKESCDTVYRQETRVKGGDGKQLPCINLIGSIHPKASRRILLLAHWDSRPWADEDTKDQDKPILAADDAASGVAVLLELARTIKGNGLSESLGVDIFLTDVEDYGRTEWGEESYCLGTQYWAKNPHVPGYKAQFGILLDMVGARNARFPMEGSSSRYAPEVQQRVWQAAATAGYSSYFPAQASGSSVTDDHVYVNELAHIPTIDIINLQDARLGTFAPHWHTHADDMNIIDPAVMEAVGQTVLQVLFEEASPS